MKYEIIIRPEAEDDLAETYSWLEERKAGLGFDFLLCFEASLESIQKSPILYPEAYKGIRRRLVRRFPYGVFYVLSQRRIVIMGVLHVRRNPEILKKRK
jgi:plasmid stabilization system protein ParE